ncbi:MAG: type IV pilus modification protein PilV, partial [Pseudomonadota bacterium]
MKQYKQTGFTLIEVLVSVFVLALGVIGAAGMQLTAMSTSQQSGSQTLALQLATELAENMRMNAGQMVQPPATNLYLSATGVGPSHSPGAAIPAPAVLCNGPGNSCTSAQLALFDIYEWKRR